MNKGIEIFSLKGKTALVTGATGYLGQSMVQALAEAGAHVIINGRNTERVLMLTETLSGKMLSVERAIFDITKPSEIDDFVKNLNRPLDILINNAYSGSAGNISCSKGDSYTNSYDISLVATHNLLQKLLPNLREAAKTNGGSSIINIASMYGIVSPDQRIYDSPQGVNPPFYGAAKAALIQWTRYAACEFGKENIRVNAISPGPFPSKSVQDANPEFINRLKQKVPMGRIGLSDEIQGAILFLASSASSYVNGSNLVVDGGWTCW